jgi:hypothetical protein
MSDSSIPPKPPANVLNAATPPAKPQGTTQRLLDEAAPVKQSPADIGSPPVKLEGRIVSQNRDTGETRIATPRGEIVVNSDKPMPKDTTVTVELTQGRDGKLMAQIALLREKVAAAETADLPAPATAKPPPAPPLKPGDIVTALVMRDETASTPPPAQGADIPLQRAAQVLERLTADMLRQLPKPLPVPNEVIQQLATAPDKLAALQKLPPEQQQAILNYLAKPEAAAKLSQMIQLPPPVPAQTQTPAPPQTQNPSPAAPAPQNAAPETDMPPLPVPAGKGTGSAPPPAGVGALKGLLPLIESLQNANPAAGGLMPRMTGGQKTDMPQGLQGLIPSMSQLRIISITPQGETPPVPQQGQVLGEVEFATSNGQLSIRAGGQSFLLRLPASLPMGTQVLFEPTPMTPQQVMTTFQMDALRQTAAPAGFTPLWSTTWPALQETMDTLGAISAQTAQAIQNSIPSPTPRLVPTALFFLAALRSGAVESWLGEGTLQSLRQAGKSALADRLTGDFGKISAQSKEPVSGEWRAISMPMMHDGEIGQMQFYIRRQQQDDTPEKDDDMRAAPPTRFILNLHLSRMGDMQLDGLLRKKTFDLILRSADALPESMRRELMGSFAKGLKQAEMDGGISFQTRAQKWVTIDTPMQGTTA